MQRYSIGLIFCLFFCLNSLSFANPEHSSSPSKNNLAASLFHPEAEGPAAQLSYKKGFYFKYGENTLLINGYVQADGYAFLRHSNEKSRFLIRRGRVNFEGSFQNSFRVYISTNWTIPSVNLNKAYVDTLGPKYARLTVGIFNEPFSLEALLPDEAVDFIERTPGTINFIQTQDAGIMVYGSVLEDRFNYAAGVFNGTGHFPENNSKKEYVSRIVLVPFLLEKDSFFNQTYLGFSGSSSHQRTNLSNTFFITGAGTKFWIWDDFVSLDAVRNRTGADIEWFYGPLVIRAEYLYVNWGKIRKTDTHPHRFAHFSAESAYLEALYILTGEKKIRNELVQPRSNVKLNCDGWSGYGAWEVGLRYDILSLNPDALKKKLAKGSSRIHGIWAGVNWYLNPFFLVQVNWARYFFEDKIIINNHTIRGEQVLLGRFQGIF